MRQTSSITFPLLVRDDLGHKRLQNQALARSMPRPLPPLWPLLAPDMLLPLLLLLVQVPVLPLLLRAGAGATDAGAQVHKYTGTGVSAVGGGLDGGAIKSKYDAIGGGACCTYGEVWGVSPASPIIFLPFGRSAPTTLRGHMGGYFEFPCSRVRTTPTEGRSTGVRITECTYTQTRFLGSALRDFRDRF